MPNLKLLFLLSSLSLLAFLISITPLAAFLPQIVAFLVILFFALHLSQSIAQSDHLAASFVTFIVMLIVFTTGGLSSPVFFLTYFLLFSLAFQNTPKTILPYSAFLIILLSQSLNSIDSLIPLVSLLFISPLVWIVSQEHLSNNFMSTSISQKQTDALLWLSLRFKNSLTQIIDQLTMLSLDPKLSPTQKRDIVNLRRRSKSLLTSSRQLVTDIEEEDYGY